MHIEKVVKIKKNALIAGQTNVQIRSLESHLFMSDIKLVGRLKQLYLMQL